LGWLHVPVICKHGHSQSLNAGAFEMPGFDAEPLRHSTGCIAHGSGVLQRPPQPSVLILGGFAVGKKISQGFFRD
jgi:hypothetical protein